ncbi:hypothetical protein BO94DRAFT_593418 [Aspergillus sclerotioniger CBS 115572]|uniref:Uncharacterized protein n=1 Tax=Aspergillus sclerotioniger CBS 115572 TaxID=1450535 RepID=A0A317WW10_9EURO|nr:hypothetical protein BO94DRAFT_593418 [Aspergillus sclerotioniger CBS 115572]PWY90549.1 hypothetical protein BO94DRAFT_593418 [Aspergillus sclerotioniger CBS 115572]
MTYSRFVNYKGNLFGIDDFHLNKSFRLEVDLDWSKTVLPYLNIKDQDTRGRQKYVILRGSIFISCALICIASQFCLRQRDMVEDVPNQDHWVILISLMSVTCQGWPISLRIQRNIIKDQSLADVLHTKHPTPKTSDRGIRCIPERATIEPGTNPESEPKLGIDHVTITPKATHLRAHAVARVYTRRKAQDAAREKERDNLVKDLTSIDVHGRKVASSYSEFVAMLESNAKSNVIPKQIALQMLTTLSDSIISICKATHNVSTFIHFASGTVGGDSDSYASETKDPATYSRVTPGETKSVSSQSRAPSTVTDAFKAMSPAEIRRTRQRAKTPAPPETPPLKPTGAAATSEMPAPATPTPVKAGSLRAQRLASQSKTPAASIAAALVSTSLKLSDVEASAFTIIAEYMSTEREDAESSSFAEQLMASIKYKKAKGSATTDAIKAVRSNMGKDKAHNAERDTGNPCKISSEEPVVAVPNERVEWDTDTAHSLHVAFAPVSDNTSDFTRNNLRNKIPRRYFDVKMTFAWQGVESVFLRADDGIIPYVFPPAKAKKTAGQATSYGKSYVYAAAVKVSGPVPRPKLSAIGTYLSAFEKDESATNSQPGTFIERYRI